MGATVMYEDRTVGVASETVNGDRLWLSPSDLEAATGWVLKPEGLCRGEACVPLPADGCWLDGDGRVELTAFAARAGRPVVHDAEHRIWAFGESISERGDLADSLMAPDFRLPDVDGVEHALSDLRGRKVFLMSWGSYCGCRVDLPVWEVLYRELRDEGFEIVAVALDAGGRRAVEPSIRCEPAAIPESLRTVMGWGEREWAAKAPPTYMCLVDEGHLVADLFAMNNVPIAVWINEQGRIVRPAEPAGATDNFRQLDPVTFELPEDEVQRLQANRRAYWDALRDWVRNGDDSRFALSPEQVRAAMKRPGRDDVIAAAHARVGQRLFEDGEHHAASAHFRAASELCPDKWNYRRQSMVLTPEMIGELNAGQDFFDAVAALGTRPYYDPITIDGVQPDPLADRR